MGTVTNISRSNFSVGELIQHRLFDYRGVIVDVDSKCQASDEWYEIMAKSRPPKDKPWYHVLVHNATHTTYVAEQNLEAVRTHEPINHPMLEHFFSKFDGERYISGARTN
ncbi:MAG: heat shock protein HspQ [Gammaproteobacteria bacterium]